MSESENKLQVRMLGKFEMKYEGKELRIGYKMRTKPLRLLQILLHAGQEGIPRYKLVRDLFGADTEIDMVNNLGVVVYRLRKLLSQSGLPDENYIVANDELYRFVATFPVEIDALTFEKCSNETDHAQGQKRLELLRECCDIYQGHFLPELEGEHWVEEVGAHYQYQYFNCLEELCCTLKEEGNYEEIEQRCSKAAYMYPFDEWQTWQIEALIASGRSLEALDLYQQVTAMYLDEMDMQPPERMQECFRQMSGTFQQRAEDMNRIQGELAEEMKKGAYFCSYPSFVDNYHIIERGIERTGRSVYLMLCTIMGDDEKIFMDRKQLIPMAKQLEKALQETLRRGDIFTRYNRSQHLVILSGIHEEDCVAVFSRVDTNFQKKVGGHGVHISYHTIPAGSLEEKNLQYEKV